MTFESWCQRKVQRGSQKEIGFQKENGVRKEGRAPQTDYEFQNGVAADLSACAGQCGGLLESLLGVLGSVRVLCDLVRIGLFSHRGRGLRLPLFVDA